MRLYYPKMLQTFSKIVSRLNNVFLQPEVLYNQQSRTTYILKRRYQAPLHKKGLPQKRLRSKYYIYDLVKDTNVEKRPQLELILTEYVKKLGNPGERVTVPSEYGYHNLLLPGLAIYASPENLEAYKDVEVDHTKHSSRYAQSIVEELSTKIISIVMNRENPWTIQPWHIKVSFRKCGYIVPEKAITMPEKPITGPDMNIQDKEFFVTITINNTESVKVKCRIHHWSTNIVERMPHVHDFWKEHIGSVFPEDTAELSSTTIQTK
ncbi:hypothetical protein FQA39_LY06947 [Lamprigera yunnana]|nr:hypothetical protein FQA39_LY06947 [Lamprigera yunnana]